MMGINFEEIVKDAPNVVTDRLDECKEIRENPKYHPEESVYEHLKIVTERVNIVNNNDLIMSAVLHDLCKVDVLGVNKKTGYPTSYGHERSIYNLIQSDESLRDWIESKGCDVNRVALICKNHMRFHVLPNMRDTKREKTLSNWKKEGIYEELKILGAADNMMVSFDINNLEKSWKSM